MGLQDHVCDGTNKLRKGNLVSKTVSNFVLIMLHLVVLQAWSGASLVKETCRSSVRVVNSGITRFRRLKHFRDKARGASAIANRVGSKVHNYRQARHG